MLIKFHFPLIWYTPTKMVTINWDGDDNQTERDNLRNNEFYSSKLLWTPKEFLTVLPELPCMGHLKNYSGIPLLNHHPIGHLCMDQINRNGMMVMISTYFLYFLFQQQSNYYYREWVGDTESKSKISERQTLCCIDNVLYCYSRRRRRVGGSQIFIFTRSSSY